MSKGAVAGDVRVYRLMRDCVRTLLIVLALCGCAATPRADFNPQQPHLKIVSYNVNWGFVHPGNVVDYLAGEDADIVCLQETHRYWESALEAQLGKKYPYCVFHEWESAGGVAILSRYELQDARLLEPNEGWFPAILTRVQTPVGLIQILNVHLRPPLSDRGAVSIGAYFRATDIHCRELEDFISHTASSEPLIIMGDFNENENGKAVSRLVERGFTDALSVYDKYTKTWVWRTSSGIALKNRYDHILYSRHLSCAAAKVTPVEGSDHMPVVAVIVRKN